MFKPGQKVYVYFPLRAPGHSPKFTSQWRGPYTVQKSISDVTYAVNCGRNGQGHVIHVDRVRPCPEHILRGEQREEESETGKDKQDVSNESDGEVPAGEIIVETPELEIDQTDRPKRE